jgi:phosphoglycolate phosphatase
MRLPADIRTVTLDLDGTLLDTIGDLATAANGMLGELGRPTAPLDDIRGYVGKGIAELVRRCLERQSPPDDTQLDHAVEIFKRHYRLCNGETARTYPGVREGLAKLKALGLPMAVVTNKAAAFTDPLLLATGLAPYFAFTVSGDTLAERKPHPLPLLHAAERLGVRPEANLHVGDSAHDAHCARAAGCPVVLVPYGYSGAEGVRGLDCDVIFGSLDELADALAARFQTNIP